MNLLSDKGIAVRCERRGDAPLHRPARASQPPRIRRPFRCDVSSPVALLVRPSSPLETTVTTPREHS
jgi:hypothetical protein